MTDVRYGDMAIPKGRDPEHRCAIGPLVKIVRGQFSKRNRLTGYWVELVRQNHRHPACITIGTSINPHGAVMDVHQGEGILPVHDVFMPCATRAHFYCVRQLSAAALLKIRHADHADERQEITEEFLADCVKVETMPEPMAYRWAHRIWNQNQYWKPAS